MVDAPRTRGVARMDGAMIDRTRRGEQLGAGGTAHGQLLSTRIPLWLLVVHA